MRNPNAHLPKGKPCPWCGGEAQIWAYETAPRFIAVCGEVVDCLWIGPCPVKPRTGRHKTRVAGEGGNQHENEAVNLISDSLGIGSINGFCIFANRIAEPRRHGKYPLRNPIEHISIRTRKGDILTPKMMQSKIPELLKKLGYAICAWILVQHIKGGEPHYHLGILRIDDKGRIPNPKSKGVCFDLAQKFARELGFKPAF